jgi:protein-S-isoprenylcysteine O-methyltransferase Ste14
MNWLYFIIGISWIGFWVYWITAAVRTGLLQGARQHRRHRMMVLLTFIILFSFFARVSKIGQMTFQHQPLLKTIGVVIFYGGMMIAVWARLTLGENWNLPMSVGRSSHLVTSGPYRLVRHPIYTALNLMVLGSAIVLTRAWAVLFIMGLIYAVYSSYQEDKNLFKQFPKEYPSYKKRTKMFVPYLI